MVKDENNLLNLKDVLKAHISQYYHTAGNTLTRHETLTKAFSIFKISAMMSHEKDRTACFIIVSVESN